MALWKSRQPGPSHRALSWPTTASGRAGRGRACRDVITGLSRLDRSLGQIVAVLDVLSKAGIALAALKENIRIEGKQDQIRHFLQLGVSITSIAKITGVSRTALYSFMRPRGSRADA